jgi:hypothetical protein
LFQGFNQWNEVGNFRNSHVLDGTRRSLGDGLIERCGSTVRNEDAIDARSLTTAKNGTQVVWVLDIVEEDYQGRIVARFENLIGVSIGVSRSLREKRNDTLMVCVLRQPVEIAPISSLDGYLLAARSLGQLTQA